MRVLATLFLAALAWAAPLAAQETIVSDLSQNRVSITANFDGSQIFVFGAVRRYAEVPEDAGRLEVVIEVAGPPRQVTVRKKDRRWGIWVNTESLQIDRAPSFYAIAATSPLADILPPSENALFTIGLQDAVKLLQPAADRDFDAYRAALIRLRSENGHYVEGQGDVRLSQATLFTAEFLLPANLTEGDYTARIVLIRGQRVIATATNVITVRKSGLEKWLYDLAHEQALLYGLLSLAIALFSGWFASEVFRLLRR